MSYVDRNWDPQLAEGFPDSRLQTRKTVVRARMLWEECFCASCGKPGGLITADFAAHVFYLCDDCVFKHGKLPLKEVPREAK